jgi:ABC-type sugar transport system permease subunit
VGWLLVVPLVAYLALFLAYPTAHALRLAFTDPLTGGFPSLVNLETLWRDSLFWQAVVGNLVLPVLTLAIELVAGLGLALLFATRLPARRWLRALVILPFALPEIVFLTIMRWVLAPRGYANAALAVAGLGPVDWLGAGRPLTFLVVAAVDAWHVTPVVFLVLLSALLAIPPEVNEAARLDGARGFAQLAFITLPLLRPALVAAVLLRGVDALRVFATPLVLAGVEGLPVLSTYAYHQWSDYGNDGAAAAAAVALAFLGIALTGLVLVPRREQA